MYYVSLLTCTSFKFRLFWPSTIPVKMRNYNIIVIFYLVHWIIKINTSFALTVVKSISTILLHLAAFLAWYCHLRHQQQFAAAFLISKTCLECSAFYATAKKEINGSKVGLPLWPLDRTPMYNLLVTKSIIQVHTINSCHLEG